MEVLAHAGPRRAEQDLLDRSATTTRLTRSGSAYWAALPRSCAAHHGERNLIGVREEDLSDFQEPQLLIRDPRFRNAGLYDIDLELDVRASAYLADLKELRFRALLETSRSTKLQNPVLGRQWR